jgi:hypothetical protein
VLRHGSATSDILRRITSELKRERPGKLVSDERLEGGSSNKGLVNLSLAVSEGLSDPMVAFLLSQDVSARTKTPLNVTAQIDGKDVTVLTEYQEGKSQWYKIAVMPGRHNLKLNVVTKQDSLVWNGKASVWFVANQKQTSRTIELALVDAPVERALPPVVWPAGEIRRNVKLGELKLSAAQSH